MAERKEITVGYIPEMDRTIIFESVYSEDREIKTEELVGWYFGRPNEEDTEIFSNGKYKAIF